MLLIDNDTEMWTSKQHCCKSEELDLSVKRGMRCVLSITMTSKMLLKDDLRKTKRYIKMSRCLISILWSHISLIRTMLVN